MSIESLRIRIMLLGLLMLGAACAGNSVPRAEEPIDWADADESWSIHVVTLDPDGDERVTRIWMALLDRQGVFRTNDSRWWANILRTRELRVRHAGSDHLFEVVIVEDLAERARIDEVFLQKYAGWERMMFPQESGETHENYGRLVRPFGSRSRDAPI